MNSIPTRLVTALTLALALLCGLLLVMGVMHPTTAALAQGTLRYVTPTGNDSGNDCTNSNTPCATVQHGVDVANPGDEIRVASGVYTGVQARPRADLIATGLVTQVVYVSQTVTIQGGYTPTNWLIANPEIYSTTLDAQGQGRVFYVNGTNSLTITGLHITGGDASGLGGNPSGSRAAGGGLYVISATVVLDQNQIVDNQAQTGGGLAVLNSAGATLVGNTIANNRVSADAGGVYFRSSLGVRLVGNLIKDNVVTGGGQTFGGGGGFSFSDGARLIGNTISGNIAQNGCGGLCIGHSTDVTLEGNIIMNNFAGGGGAGGGLALSVSQVDLTNNVIADNRAGVSGAALSIVGADVRLRQTTISSNSGGDGSGIYITNSGSLYSFVAMTNTILVSQTIGLTVTANNAATLTGVLWDNNGLNTSGAGAFTLNNEYTGDPAFAADGYHLTAGSAALDRGVPTDVTTDIDGDPRPMGLGDDLGADELRVGLVVTKQAFPNPVQAGSLLTYTIRLTNTGDMPLSATITDILPASVTPTGMITWTPVVTAPGGVWVQPVTVTVSEDYNGPLTNTVKVTTDEGVSGIFTETTTAIIPLTAVSIKGPVIGVVNTTYSFTAQITPATATQPITYTWSPTPNNGQETATVTYVWPETGAKTIAVTATNVGATVTDALTITIYPTPTLTVVKEAYPDPVSDGATLTFTISITNISEIDLHATIADTLPEHLTTTGPLIWSPITIAPGSAWRQSLVVTVETGLTGTLTNKVTVSTKEGATGEAMATVCVNHCLFLPIIQKDAVFEVPDTLTLPGEVD